MGNVENNEFRYCDSEWGLTMTLTDFLRQFYGHLFLIKYVFSLNITLPHWQLMTQVMHEWQRHLVMCVNYDQVLTFRGKNVVRCGGAYVFRVKTWLENIVLIVILKVSVVPNLEMNFGRKTQCLIWNLNSVYKYWKAQNRIAIFKNAWSNEILTLRLKSDRELYATHYEEAKSVAVLV